MAKNQPTIDAFMGRTVLVGVGWSSRYINVMGSTIAKNTITVK